MTDLLTETRREITERLEELKPLVEEFHRLQEAAAALAAAIGSAASETAEVLVRSRRRGRRRRSGRHRATRATGPKTPSELAAAKAPKPVRAKAARKPAKRAGGRRKGSGTRAAQALSLVQAQPGITTGEIAAKMGIATNYLYRVLPDLEKEGKVRKEGRGWQATRA